VEISYSILSIVVVLRCSSRMDDDVLMVDAVEEASRMISKDWISS